MFLRLPALAYTPAPFARAFPGTISGNADWVAGAVLEIAATLGRQGVAVMGLASAHLDPANVTALRQAVKRAGQTPGCAAVVFPDLTSRPWALWLGEEFKTGACHAGRFETSIVMAVRPDLVNEQVRHQLPAVPASLSQAIRAGKNTFEEAGGPRAYFGWPAEATALEGRAHLDTLARLLADEVHSALQPEPAQ